MVDAPPPLMRSLLRTALRIGVIVAIGYSVHLLMNWVLEKAEILSPSMQNLMLTSLVAIVLLSYALLIAVPFVPGIEIGVTLIVMRGAPIAPYVYIATVLGLVTAYLLGRHLPYSWLNKALLDCRLTRASRLLEHVQSLPPEKRIELMCERLPKKLGGSIVRWRYVVLAVLINIPGNSLIGGGGGITMISGLSRVFRPAATITTIALAVSPVPIFVWFFGIELFT